MAKFKKQMRPRNYYSSGRAQSNIKNEPDDQMGLNEAYRVLHVSPDAPWREVQSAYKERMAKSHPDKVSHLGEELTGKGQGTYR